MSETAWNVLDGIAARYVKQGYPHLDSFKFAPKDADEVRAFDALGGAGQIRRFDATLWVLTEAGLERVRDKEVSAEASALYADLKRQHAALRLLSGEEGPFGPDHESQLVFFNELRARGYLKQVSASLFVFSEEAIRKMKGA